MEIGVPDNKTLVTVCCVSVAETVRLEVLLWVLCCRSLTLAGSCRLVERVLCEETTAEDMLISS